MPGAGLNETLCVQRGHLQPTSLLHAVGSKQHALGVGTKLGLGLFAQTLLSQGSRNQLGGVALLAQRHGYFQGLIGLIIGKVG